MTKFINKFKNNKILSWVLRIIKTICGIIIFCILAVILVQKVTNNSVNLGGYGIYTVVSGSMEPNLHIKDMILAKKVANATLEVNDIVVYMGQEKSMKDHIITHRIIEKGIGEDGVYYITKGDANSVEDPEIRSQQILGKYVTTLSILSLCSHIINTPAGFFFIIFVPFVIFGFIEFLDIKKELKEVNGE